MVCIEKCLHFKRKCRHHPHPILDILPVYLTRGISNTSVGAFCFTYRYNDTYMVNTQAELVGFEPTCPGGLTH